MVLPLVLLSLFGWSCRPADASPSPFAVTAAENFLADIAQNIAGDRLVVAPLIPYGIEPHEFEPTPRDMILVSDSDLLIVNGAGLEGWLEAGLESIGGTRIVVAASSGLVGRSREGGSAHSDADPHFWMNPILVKTYVSNILAGLVQLDPEGESLYRRNAETYTASLDELDRWISTQVAQIAPDQKILVTNHESLGYFADRYGFVILGSIFPGVSPDAQPTASQMADLVVKIRASGARAIFLETCVNSQMADQIAREAGCRVVTGLYTHSLTPPGGIAATYLAMMRHNVNLLVEALR
ncbi:MAG: zinc ABC transporter substrate-binding protein [Anaerolineales bacterium]|nr:zinc ABC transporter substrate-binding protein [Anaerolineales bacterium]